jgi:hypothetical protein
MFICTAFIFIKDVLDLVILKGKMRIPSPQEKRMRAIAIWFCYDTLLILCASSRNSRLSSEGVITHHTESLPSPILLKHHQYF